jgi:2-oxoglutarate ferredoxin oxidoreductase subunit gamma
MVVNVEREILLTGVGGQGIQLAAQVLARAGVADGREVMLLGTYGGTMRGGSTDSCLVIADEPIRTPPIVSRVWAVLAMHDRFFAPSGAKLRAGSLAFVNSDLFEAKVDAPGVRVLGVEATRVANQVASSMAASLVLVAGFAGATGLVTLGSLLSALEECVPSYRRQHIEANQRALHSGFELLTGQAEPAWPDEANAA